MYKQYWHLKERPFENVIDFRYLFASPYFEECLARLFYGVTEKKQGVVLTGNYGAGKSTVREALVKKIKENTNFNVISIVHAKMSIEDIILDCLYQLKINEYPKEKPLLLHTFGNKLIEFSENNKHTVMIIDDAHLIEMPTLAELKLILNLHDYNQRSILTLVLVGEPGMLPKLMEIPSLQQRLRIVANLQPLDRGTTEEYIKHRLRIAGGEESIFLPEAIDEIYRFSHGILREINNICDIALLIAFNERIARVTAEVILRIIDDMTYQWAENKF